MDYFFVPIGYLCFVLTINDTFRQFKYVIAQYKCEVKENITQVITMCFINYSPDCWISTVIIRKTPVVNEQPIK